MPGARPANLLRATGHLLLTRTVGLVGVVVAAVVTGQTQSATVAVGSVTAVIVAIAAAEAPMRGQRLDAGARRLTPPGSPPLATDPRIR